MDRSNFLILSGAGARWTRDFLKNFLLLDPQAVYLASGRGLPKADADTFVYVRVRRSSVGYRVMQARGGAEAVYARGRRAKCPTLPPTALRCN